ncbi:MAG: hypothetical protein ACT4NY_26525 [Pseudonocardiales bacterium]
MTQLPDIHVWIKVIEDKSGKTQLDGTAFSSGQEVTVRYSIANDSHQTAGPMTVVGVLRRDGVRVQPNGQSNVVPVQQITLQPGRVWSREHHLTEIFYSSGMHLYSASLLGDVGNFVNEEDEQNNRAKMTFSFVEHVK